ncbi:TolC family protein [Chamaesiphon sp.]|uniref:TolC family protein n=1 Tax=Chamaesiphon sp. TaxID=2814140 RepID=UPI003592F4F5
MLTPIALIHQLIDRIVEVNSQPSISYTLADRHRHARRFRAIWATIVLSCSGLGSISTARATSLDFARIDRDRQPATTHQSRPTLIAQNNSTTPVSGSNGDLQLPNDLNLPKTGAEVQITTTRSLTLPEALEIAFRNNRQVQAARLTVARSQVGIAGAQAAQSVQVGVTSTIQNQGSPLIIGDRSPLVNGNSSDVQGTLQATYNILSAGRNESSVRAAQEQVRFDRLDLVRVEQLIRGNVITAYFDLQAADSAIIINQASVIDATRSLSDAQLQERAGVGTKFDILRAQVQLATANQDLTNSQAQQQNARKNLAQLLVVDNNTQFTAADPVRELGTWSYSLDDSIVLAFANRPETAQQLSLRRISQQQQIIASAADSAQVNLFARYGLGKSLSTNSSAQDNYSLGAQLSWNFLDGGAAGANSNREIVSQQIFENQFTTTRNQIRFQVEQAFSNLGSNRKNIATSTQALTQAEESLKLARLRFQAGVGTQTDVINAQTALATARGNRITAILNYNRALATLRVATVTEQ